jgi:hypothetical protein
MTRSAGKNLKWRTLGMAATLLLISGAGQAQSENACGYISATTKPPLSQDVYPAEIKKIDGEDTPKRAKTRYRLSAGRHSIAVQEHVADNPGGYTKLRKLGNKAAPLIYKVLEIEVKADTGYHIGAKLYADRISADAPNDFWEPVVWRRTIDNCH